MKETDEAMLLAEEIPDSELEDIPTDCIHEVRVYGYDEFDRPTEYERGLGTYATMEEAEAVADSWVPDEIPPLPTVYVRVEAENKIDVGCAPYLTIRSRVITFDKKGSN